MKDITLDELKTMRNREGLIIQGCGGDPQEWIDGIQDLLTTEGILLDGDTFKDVFRFENEGVTCLLFDFRDTKLNVGKLAVWRLSTHGAFGGTWLSDYLDNRFGKEIQTERKKPDCPLIGQDGNIFGLVGIAVRILRENGMREEATEMTKRVTSSGSYSEALGIIGEYINITSVDEDKEEDEDEFEEDWDFGEDDEDEGLFL